MVMQLISLPREAILRPDFWRISPPVPVRVKPVKMREARDPGLGEAGLADLWSALDAIPNEGEHEQDYDTWLAVCHGVHWACGGSDEGLERFEAWSARSGKHVDGYADAKVWSYADAGRVGGVTAATVFALASRLGGWVNPGGGGGAGIGAVPDEADFDAVGVGSVVVVGGMEVAAGEGSAGGVVDARGADLEAPAYARERNGAIKPTMENAVRALRRADQCGLHIALDQFRDELMVAGKNEPQGQGWRAMRDADVVRLRIELERRNFKSVPKELARDGAVLVGDENQFDSAQMWLTGLREWDGVPRVERFLEKYFGCEPGAYVQAVSMYMWTALAGRVLDPGCQADMAPVLEGDQGLRKTSAIAALVPSEDFFVELDFEKDEVDTARLMRGVLVAEISELRGLHTRDQESIKAFVSRRYEKWTPKYKEFATTYARRCVLFGTTNRTDILADETGNRRWLPVHVERADVEGIARAREQLWAEASALWRGAVAGKGAGVAWKDAETLAKGEHGGYMRFDLWEEPVRQWLDEPEGMPTDVDGNSGGGTRGDGVFTISELMAGALGIAPRDMDIRAMMRVGAVLRGLGFKKHNNRIDGKQGKRWTRVATPATPALPLEDLW